MAGDAREIVVAYDGSPDSDAAVAWATRVASRRSVGATAIVESASLDAPVHEDDRQEMLARARRTIQTSGAPEVRIRIVRGPMDRAIRDAAREAAMVVVGSSAHGRLGQVVLHATGSAPGRIRPCPLVVVRSPRDPTAHRLVVGVDGSQPSLRALDFACRHARAAADVVTVLQAWRSVDVGVGVGEPEPTSAPQDQAMRRRYGRLQAIAAAAEAEHPAVPVAYGLVRADPGQALVDASSRANLVVVGTRGLSAVEDAVLGSVSQYVVRHAHCPVAVVH